MPTTPDPKTEIVTVYPSADGAIAPSGGVVAPSLPADRNPVLVYLASLAPRSRITMRQSLQVVADLFVDGREVVPAEAFPWWHLRYQHMEGIRSKLAVLYAHTTANKILTAVRQVLLRCRRLGLMSVEDYVAAEDVAAVRGRRLQSGRCLLPAELSALLTATDDMPIGARDRAIIMTLARAGLRREEASALRMADYDAAQRTLRVIGKGNKERQVPVSPSLATSLAEWVEVRGDEPGPLFCQATRSGRLLRTRAVTHQTIYVVLAKLAERAEVKDLTPHDFRRTFVSTLLDQGVDVATVSRLAGHEQAQTTMKYDRRGEKSARKAVDLLDAATEDEER